MYDKLEQCPSCKFTKFDTYRIVQDYSISGESFALVTCAKCGLVFTNPRPNETTLPNYYKSDAYISHANKATNLINFIYKLVRIYTTHQKIQLVNRFATKGSLLDFGCGTGHFLSAAKKNHWITQGLEPDTLARTTAETQLKQPIYSTLSQIPTSEIFDVITAWHVLEHVSSLNETISTFYKKLKTSGTLLIAVPNYRSFDAQTYREFWAGYDVPRHLYHFDQQSASYLFSKHKFKITQVLPMKFDSYYVSMLSEKYQTRSNNYMKSFRIGYQSNKLAHSTGEFSSLIYVLRK